MSDAVQASTSVEPPWVRLKFTRGHLSFALSAPTQRAVMARWERMRTALLLGSTGWTIESINHDPLQHERADNRGPARLEFDASGNVIT
jgi:hypothetical protein